TACSGSPARRWAVAGEPTMRALRAAAFGLDRLEVGEVPRPRPGRGEVLVRVHASAVNPADKKVVTGSFAGRFLHARRLPLVPGYDFSGVVEAAAEDVTDLAPGAAVFGHLPYAPGTAQGCFAELVAVRRGELARKPDAVPHEIAAASAT